MKKATMVFSFLFLVVASFTYAHSIRGAFISVRQTADGSVMDQFIFNPDGTVYWNQSNSLVKPVKTGMFIAEVGTWKHVTSDIIVVTTIGASANPIPKRDDVTLSSYTRDTFEFQIIDENTLRSIRRVFRGFDVHESPLLDEGSIVGMGTTPIMFKKVQIREEDLASHGKHSNEHHHERHPNTHHKHRHLSKRAH